MLKRAIGLIWKNEGPYENWTRRQLLERIKELESIASETTEAETTKKSRISNEPPAKKPKRKFDFSDHSKRFIALRFAYAGWNYNGLAFQNEPTPLPTVEQEILEALTKARLIIEPDPSTCKFSRCGRTDKGVSAMNQVISLEVRSGLTEEQRSQPGADHKEIPYITILNSLLPPSIRITGVCLNPPPGFDARFSCSYRHYRYIFRRYDLDLEAMTEAAKKYEGEHDFRNFCKIDGSKQISNYCRTILSANIMPLKDDYYVFDLKGTAFLWHQVRCMMGILFLVGRKLEKPSLVDELLDVTANPNKPNYDMANDVPLVLYDCVFPDIKWTTATDSTGVESKILKERALTRQQVLDHSIKAQIISMLEEVFVGENTRMQGLTQGGGIIDIGDGKGRNFKNYTPVMQRDRTESFEVINARWLAKGKKKAEKQQE
ncbi:tRNA pseudouridine [Meyerozyma sp. JA9]|nr:tRNA pseudouridine [Meyerozyma sp. JA9]